jgi:hypothetical protein
MSTQSFVRTWGGTPEVDVEKRTISRCVVATIGLASDGWIILPSGIDLSNYLSNPVVTARHLMSPGNEVVVQTADSMVIARCLGLTRTSDELVADAIQFADTEQGRDFAYLYGVNPSREAYMRAWSVEGIMLNRVDVTFERAKELSGQYWDEATAARVRKSQKKVNLCGDFVMLSFAAVATGADKNALSRAARDGIKSADGLIARLDLDEAGGELASIKKMLGEKDTRIEQLEHELQALRGEGASAAVRGDSEALLDAVRELVRTLP